MNEPREPKEAQVTGTLDVALSRRVIEAMVKPPEYQQCFRNAQVALYMAVMFVTGPDGDLDDWKYVEGATHGGHHVHHAWLETPDGWIVELTEIFLEHPQTYRAINRWTRDEVVESVLARMGQEGGYVRWMLSPQEEA